MCIVLYGYLATYAYAYCILLAMHTVLQLVASSQSSMAYRQVLILQYIVGSPLNNPLYSLRAYISLHSTLNQPSGLHFARQLLLITYPLGQLFSMQKGTPEYPQIVCHLARFTGTPAQYSYVRSLILVGLVRMSELPNCQNSIVHRNRPIIQLAVVSEYVCV